MKRKRFSVMGILTALVVSLTLTFSSANVSAEETHSFDLYLADYLASNSYAQDYIYKPRSLPYRTYVEERRNSDVYLGLLASWEMLTFDGKAADKTSKAIAFYETILYDTLFGGVEGNSILNSVTSTVSSLKAGTIKSLYDFAAKCDEQTLTELFPEWDTIEDFNLDDIEQGSAAYTTILEEFAKMDSLKSAFGTISDLKGLLDNGKNAYEAVEKLAKIEALAEKKTELKAYLQALGDKGNAALQLACNRMRVLLDENYSVILKGLALSADGLVDDAVDELIKKLWNAVLDDLLGAGMSLAVSVGQKTGKLASDALFSTENDIECVYSMIALYEIEDITRDLLKQYCTQYKSNPTQANARIFAETFRQMLRIYIEGTDYTLKYGDIVHEQGAINKIFNLFREDDYDVFVEKLGNIRSGFEEDLEFFDATVYNWYAQGIPNEKAYSQYVRKKIPSTVTVTTTQAQVEHHLTALTAIEDSYANRIVNANWTLTEDTSCSEFGNMIMTDGTLDLNGFTLTVHGNLLQKGGTIKVNNGTLNVEGNYSMENVSVNNVGETEYNECTATLSMAQEHDKVNISGNLTLHNCYRVYSGDKYFERGIQAKDGELSVGGNIWANYGIICSQNSKVVLMGDGKHTATISQNDTLPVLYLADVTTLALCGSYGGVSDLENADSYISDNPDVLIAKADHTFGVKGVGTADITLTKDGKQMTMEIIVESAENPDPEEYIPPETETTTTTTTTEDPGTTTTTETVCEVSFDENGGEGNAEPISVPDDASIYLPPCLFTAPEGKIFAGWQLESDPDTVYQPGDLVTITENTKFTAVWADADDTLTIGDVNGDDNVDTQDAMLVTRYVNAWEGIELDLNAADLDRDGKVTVRDAMILTRFVNGWEGYDQYIIEVKK